jgi:hypothetical protein
MVAVGSSEKDGVREGNLVMVGPKLIEGSKDTEGTLGREIVGRVGVIGLDVIVTGFDVINEQLPAPYPVPVYPRSIGRTSH